jgi:hypothetical protein
MRTPGSDYSEFFPPDAELISFLSKASSLRREPLLVKAAQ